jgi:hypothetical protein
LAIFLLLIKLTKLASDSLSTYNLLIKLLKTTLSVILLSRSLKTPLVGLTAISILAMLRIPDLGAATSKAQRLIKGSI